MAVIGNTYVSLADVLKGTDGDGQRAAHVIELLAQRNDILQDAPVSQGNKDTGELITLRDSLPAITWYKLYGGTSPTKSTTKQVMETCGIMKALSEIDVELLKIAPDPKGARMQQDLGFLEAMNQEFVSTLFYGNVNINGEEFHGLATRYNDSTGDVADQIIDGGSASGQTDNTSIYLIGWDSDKTHLIYPKNAMGGMEMIDRGERLITKDDGRKYFAAVSEYTWRVGLAVKDRRYVSRIANLDVSAMATYGSGSDTSPKIEHLMFDALERLFTLNGGVRPMFYMPRKVHTLLAKRSYDKSNMNLTWNEIGGHLVLHFQGVPIRICDGISYAEDRVAFS